jgi:flagellar motor protein MotB
VKGKKGKNGKKGESYYLNLGLSQDRAKNVMESCLRSIEASQGNEHIPFRKKMTASGVAFSKIILDSSGYENAGASRRVEFKIITSFDDNLKSIK